MSVPLLIVGDESAMAEALDDVALRGWHVHEGWGPPASAEGVVCAGALLNASEVGPAILAALSGAGMLARVEAAPLAEQLGDDLRRLGRVDYRIPAHGWVVLDRDERLLLDLLGEGASLGEAAGRLHLGRRTADRRLASARTRLGSTSNSGAITIRRQRLNSIPRAPR